MIDVRTVTLPGDTRPSHFTPKKPAEFTPPTSGIQLKLATNIRLSDAPGPHFDKTSTQELQARPNTDRRQMTLAKTVL